MCVGGAGHSNDHGDRGNREARGGKGSTDAERGRGGHRDAPLTILRDDVSSTTVVAASILCPVELR